MSNSKIGSARKLVDSSFIWKRADNFYSSLGGASVIDGLFYYCQQKGISDEVFGRSTAKVIEDYFRKREIEPNNIVEDKCKQYNDTFRGTMFIKSRSKEEEIKHRLRVSDVVTKDSTKERKDQSLRSMNILCCCSGAHYQTFLTVPRYVRELFDDSRETGSLPSPQVLIPLDTHSVTGMNWLVQERNAEDFGIFGLKDHTIEIAKHVTGSALDKYMPEYRLNLFLRDRTDLFKPLKERLGIFSNKA